MKRGIALAAVAIGLAGCGSSSNAGNTETTVVTVGGKTTTVTVPNGKTTTKPGSSLKSSGGLRPDTTPNYASPPAGAPTQSGTVQIEYRNIAINPDAIKVKVGSTIKWTNYDPLEANVTSKGGPQKFASGNFGEGKSFELKVTNPGVIHYESTLHPVTQNGTIEVVS